MATPGAPIAPVLALTGLIAACGQFFTPAFQASLVHMVGKDGLTRCR